jgi:hypothetical protein
MLGRPEQSPQATAVPSGPVDVPSTGDLSLAELIRADRAAAVPPGFAAPPAESEGNLAESVDSSRWFLDGVTQTDQSASQPLPPELAEFLDRNPFLVGVRSDSSDEAQVKFPLMQSPEIDSSIFGNLDAPSLDSTSPADARDLLDRYGTDDSGDVVLLSDNLAEALADSPIESLSDQVASTVAPVAEEGDAPITYLPVDQVAPAMNDGDITSEKRRVEIQSSIADAKKNSVIAFLAMEPAILQAIDKAGEPDRRDALARDASRRACL